MSFVWDSVIEIPKTGKLLVGLSRLRRLIVNTSGCLRHMLRSKSMGKAVGRVSTQIFLSYPSIAGKPDEAENEGQEGPTRHVD